jgi:O-acetyl-ADP-ribose deacetylase (regulator of RNase III)
MPLTYVKGDATKPQGPGPKILTHCVNDLGRWGAGFVVSLAKRYGKAREAYYAWYKSAPKVPGEVTGRMGLGEAQLVQVDDELWIANIVGQHGIGMGAGGRPPIRYDALRKGLVAVCRWATIQKASVHMPKMGSGLAGGHWGNIEQMITTELVERSIPVTVYTLR